MSFESKQTLRDGDSVTVFTQPSGQVIRLEIGDANDEFSYATLSVAECESLIHTLQAASLLANIYRTGDS